MVLLLLQAAGLKCPDRQRRSRGVRLYKCPRGILHLGQPRPGIGLRTWLGSDQLGAVAACGRLWKGHGCRHTLPSSESSSVVSGTAETTSVAWTHGKSWTLEGIAESLICLPVMGSIPFFPFALFIEVYDKNACKRLNILNCFSLAEYPFLVFTAVYFGDTQAHWIHVCGAFASSWFQSA